MPAAKKRQTGQTEAPRMVPILTYVPRALLSSYTRRIAVPARKAGEGVSSAGAAASGPLRWWASPWPSARAVVTRVRCDVGGRKAAGRAPVLRAEGTGTEGVGKMLWFAGKMGAVYGKTLIMAAMRGNIGLGILVTLWGLSGCVPLVITNPYPPREGEHKGEKHEFKGEKLPYAHRAGFFASFLNR